jgi:hypothetical protein
MYTMIKLESFVIKLMIPTYDYAIVNKNQSQCLEYGCIGFVQSIIKGFFQCSNISCKYEGGSYGIGQNKHILDSKV